MSEDLIHIDDIQSRIFTFLGLQVMIDRDLAELYNVPVKRLNEQVKRNSERFPESFRFQLTDKEKYELVANCDRFEKLKHSSVNPYAFTEQGVAMLSSVLRSKTAINISIRIMQAFVDMKKFINTNAGIFQRLDKVEQKLIQSDENFNKLFNALENRTIEPKQDIFFNGQIFDAYSFVSSLIRSANNSIILIDNYIDDTVLTLFAKRKKDINVVILTKNINKQLSLDLKKYNEQYPGVVLKEFAKAHDRFLIIDEKEVYHFGASLKDLGKRWFAFSKMDISSVKVLDKLKDEGIL
jgi:hypothetical protein